MGERSLQEEQWAALVKQTDRFPLIYGGVAVKRVAARVTITYDWTRVLRGMLCLGLAGGICFLIWYLCFSGWESARKGLMVSPAIAFILLLPFAVLLVYGGLHLLSRVNSVFWEPDGQEVIIRYGPFYWPRTVRLSREELRVRRYPSSYRNKRSFSFPCGHTIVSLRRRDGTEGEVRLAVREFERQIQPVYEALTKFLGRDGLDESADTLRDNLGYDVRISRSPLSMCSGSFRTTEMVFPSANEVVIKSTLRSRLFFLFFLIMGVLLLIELASPAFRNHSGMPISIAIMVSLVGLVFAAIGFVGFLFGFGVQYCRFDRITQTLTLKRGIERLGRKDSFPLSGIAAVQLCSKVVTGSDEQYTAVEMNLVLAGNEGQRIALYAHSKEAIIRDEARRLADFLGKPLLDHAV